MAYPNSRAELEAVRNALHTEHVEQCRQNECDITMAYEQDYAFYAAELLSGATETPDLDAVLAQIPDWRARARAEARPFAAWFRRHTTRCPGCGAYVRKSRFAQCCSNCLAPIAASRSE